MNDFERWLSGEITTVELLYKKQAEIVEREEVPPCAALQLAEGMIDDYQYMMEVYR